MGSNEVQRKHKLERESVINEALRDSMNHLDRADGRFGAAIPDKGLQREFSRGVGRAKAILAELGVEA